MGKFNKDLTNRDLLKPFIGETDKSLRLIVVKKLSKKKRIPFNSFNKNTPINQVKKEINYALKNGMNKNAIFSKMKDITGLSQLECERIYYTRNKRKKKEISQEEKEQRSIRKQIQEKLQKFVTRIPVFMYLTDYRERTLKDVITKLESGLFKKVTGLSVNDFELLLSIGLFNFTLMNSAVFSFKRYEDSSLSYSGITKQEPSEVGLFDTVITSKEFKGEESK